MIHPAESRACFPPRTPIPWSAHRSWCRVVGHRWSGEGEGGRGCPCGGEDHSQGVYRCVRCGAYDYGEPGGPGWEETLESCPFEGDPERAAAFHAEEERLDEEARTIPRRDQAQPSESGPAGGRA